MTECPCCGASDFIETSYLEDNSNRKIQKTHKVVILTLIVTVLLVVIFPILIGIIGSVVNVTYDDTEYISNEYAYSDITSLEDLYIGKNFGTSEKDYHNEIKITGSFENLYNDVYNNIYTSQFMCIDYNVPCDIEIKESEFTYIITNINFSYFSNGEIEFKGELQGNIDKEVNIYFTDEAENKDRLLIEKYQQDEYSSIKDYLNSDAYRKAFTLNQEVKPYDKILITIGEKEYSFELNYSRAEGYIQYYGLQL